MEHWSFQQVEWLFLSKGINRKVIRLATKLDLRLKQPTGQRGCVRNLARKCLLWVVSPLLANFSGPWVIQEGCCLIRRSYFRKRSWKPNNPKCCSHFRMVVCLRIILCLQGSGRHRHRPTAEDPSTRRSSAGHPVPADQLGCWSLCHVTDLQWYNLLIVSYKLDVYMPISMTMYDLVRFKKTKKILPSWIHPSLQKSKHYHNVNIGVSKHWPSKLFLLGSLAARDVRIAWTQLNSFWCVQIGYGYLPGMCLIQKKKKG